VYSPAWLTGFHASIDYFKIKIDNAIGTVDTQTQIRECIAAGGTSPFCDNVTRPGPITDTSPANYPTSFFTGQINAALTSTEGVDLDLSYRTALDSIRSGLPGSVGLRVLTSYQPHLKIQSYSGAQVLDFAGVGDRFAKTRITTELSYNVGAFSGRILDRAKSGGRRSANPNLVFADPDIGSYNVVDLTVSYDWSVSAATAQTFLSANNVFNRDPRLFANDSPGQVTPVAADDDIIGRYITAGVRLTF